MKKRIIFLLTISMILGLIFTGCGEKNHQPEAIAPNGDNNGTLEALKVSNYSQCFLLRKGEKYHLNVINERLNESTNLGLKTEANSPFRCLYERGFENSYIREFALSLGDIPVPIIQKGDLIFDSTNSPLKITSAEFVGYTPLMRIKHGVCTVGTDSKLRQTVNQTELNIDTLRVALLDENGNKKYIEKNQWNNFEYGQTVHVYGEEAKTGKEHIYELKTNSATYKYDSSKFFKLKSIGTERVFDKDFTVYDPTELDSGYYVTNKDSSVFYVP